MIQFSYWERKHFFNFWDFTIVGSGITGLTTAIFIKKKHPKARVVIVERGILPSGASTKNAGFACFGSPSEILEDLKQMAESEVFNLVESRYRGLQSLRKLLSDKQTGYEASGSYEVFTSKEKLLYEESIEKLPFLNRQLKNILGQNTFESADTKIEKFGFNDVNHLIANVCEGMIDTGLMMKNLILLARNESIEIFNGVEVNSLDYTLKKPVLETNIGTIKTGHVVVATNGFASRLIPDLDLKPARAQVLITEPIPNLKPFGCFHQNQGFNYFRSIDNRVLIGGGRDLDKETETTEIMDTTKKLQEYLEKLLRSVILPNTAFKIENRWSGIMGVGNSKKVILEPLGPSTVIAVRFGGMGIALGSYIGQKVAETIG